MHFNRYISCTVYPAKVGIKIHALSSCFISAAFYQCFLLQFPTNYIFLEKSLAKITLSNSTVLLFSRDPLNPETVVFKKYLTNISSEEKHVHIIVLMLPKPNNN